MAASRTTDWFTVADLSCDSTALGASGACTEAMDWVFYATGSRWTGPTEATIRPVPACGHNYCGCRLRWQRLDLTKWVNGPIVSITEVRVDGDVVDPTAYVLDNRRWLSALTAGDGEDPLIPWPTQDLRRPDDDVDTWAVDVVHGAIPPPAVIDATIELACQLLRRMCGQPCDLPDNATSVSHDGVSISLALPADGLTGIPRIDTILEAAMRDRRRRLHDPAAERAVVRRS